MIWAERARAIRFVVDVNQSAGHDSLEENRERPIEGRILCQGCSTTRHNGSPNIEGRVRDISMSSYLVAFHKASSVDRGDTAAYPARFSRISPLTSMDWEELRRGARPKS